MNFEASSMQPVIGQHLMCSIIDIPMFFICKGVFPNGKSDFMRKILWMMRVPKSMILQATAVG